MSQKTRLEVATAGNPVEALARAVMPWTSPSGVFRVSVAHDDGCPCTAAGAPMTGCTCEIVELTIARATEVAA